MNLLSFMQNKNAPKVKIMNSINVDGYPWCNSAIMFSVKNGKASLKHVCSDIDDDYWYKSHLMLNNRPLLQADNPYCATCSAMLAAGYGIENIDCKELERIRTDINSEYVDIKTSAEILKPLLGLLPDGIYLLADVPHYPTDGSGKFFYDISNDTTTVAATCSSYYNHDLLTTVDGFPAYIYPTQSDKRISKERVDYYVELLKNSNNPPRAIAYYETGFMSALLDGHHKAVAAAKLGIPINCLTIIKGFECSYTDKEGNKTSKIAFSSVQILNDFKEIFWSDKPKFVEVNIEKYRLVHNALMDIKPETKAYPTVDELTNIYAIGLENTEITDELIDKWFADRNTENVLKLKYVLINFTFKDKIKAYHLARKIIADGSRDLPLKEAYKALLSDKTEHTEKLFIDYFVSHTRGDECWDIVNSYWD